METTEVSAPKTKLHGITFFPVPRATGLDVCAGYPAAMFFRREQDLPDIPRKYTDAVSSLFFKGGKLPDLSPKVDRKQASAALHSWLCSFEPPHEMKEATAAYALWVWQTV